MGRPAIMERGAKGCVRRACRGLWGLG